MHDERSTKRHRCSKVVTPGISVPCAWRRTAACHALRADGAACISPSDRHPPSPCRRHGDVDGWAPCFDEQALLVEEAPRTRLLGWRGALRDERWHGDDPEHDLVALPRRRGQGRSGRVTGCGRPIDGRRRRYCCALIVRGRAGAQRRAPGCAIRGDDGDGERRGCHQRDDQCPSAAPLPRSGVIENAESEDRDRGHWRHYG